MSRHSGNCRRRTNARPMGHNNYKKLVFLAFYLILSAFSCWATGESLRLLQPNMPGWLWYIVSLMLFVGASIGTKAVWDSLDMNSGVHHRRLLLFGGLLIFVFCWGVSMPTNTHTFFYRSYVDAKVTSDIGLTSGYLDQLRTDRVINDLIQEKQSELENQVQTRLGELESEIMNDANPGFGPKAKEILASFADMLGVAKIDPLTYTATTIDARRKLCDAYRSKIFTLMDSKKKNIAASLNSNNKNYKKVAEVDHKNLALCQDYIRSNKLDLNKPQDIKNICDQLEHSYTTIKTYKDYVHFSNDDDKARYTASTPQTEVRRLLNVYDVWKDFINGEYPASFWFWIIVSIIIDFLAFIFFAIGTRNDEY